MEERRGVAARGKDLEEAGLVLGLSCQVRVSPCFLHRRERDVDCPQPGRFKEERGRAWVYGARWMLTGPIYGALSCRRDAGVGRQVGPEAARRQGCRRQEESTG